MSEIAAHELQKDLDKLRKTPGEREHAFVVLRAFIRWAYHKHYIDQNPMERMKVPKHSVPRERILTDAELKRVWVAVGDGTYGCIVKLLILTGQRVGEVANLSADMLKESTVTLPSWLTKNNREHTFPLGPTTKTLLSKSQAPSGLLFPAPGAPSKPFSAFSKNKLKLDKISGVEEWTLHDLRRTFASGLAALGISLPVIERLLNHVSGSFGGIVGVYQRYDFMPEMRLAVEKWDGHVATIVRP